jgi:N-acetyl-1-D-myo-inositol-2-amino-2-deoxy-alpha-D-glucopyranoside deacetylase
VPPETGGVLFVHAHPDDECVSTGGSIARLVASGHRVDLVTCTDGAEGEIHDPTLDAEEARPRLAAIRAAELACSLDALGGGAIRHHLLGYRDSGMIGTDANEHPESFWQSDLGTATSRLVEIVRAARPAAIVSYDENGNYGHPDHINAARIARDAYQSLAGGPDAVARFHEVAFAREGWGELIAAMTERGIAFPWGGDEAQAEAAAAGEASEAGDGGGDGGGDGDGDGFGDFGRPDAEVTTRVDVSGFIDQKRRSMECHRTQRQDMGWLLDLPEDMWEMALGTETYVLRWLDGRDVPSTYREEWLLA